MNAAIIAVDIAFGYAGAGIVYSGHPLERCFRDLHTANQHIAFSGDGFSAYARAQHSMAARSAAHASRTRAASSLHSRPTR